MQSIQSTWFTCLNLYKDYGKEGKAVEFADDGI